MGVQKHHIGVTKKPKTHFSQWKKKEQTKPWVAKQVLLQKFSFVRHPYIIYDSVAIMV